MSSAELDNLARIGQLKREPPAPRELVGLRISGERRLADAQRAELAFDSRFDLAYNAAHALALCALRRLGLRSDSRYLVFQVLPHTLGLPLRNGACWPRRTSGAIWLNTKGTWSTTSAFWRTCWRRPR